MKQRRLIVTIPAFLFLLTLLVGGVFLKDVVAAGKNIYDELYVFNEVLRLIGDFYVEEVPADSLIEGAIVGMLDQLDPHSNYMDAKRFKEMEERNRGSYSGIGISFQIRNGNLTVISPIEGGPSYDLGIRTGDIITHIEGRSAYGIKEDEVFDKLRGPRGTKVHITVRRPGTTEALEFEIVRNDIPIQSVPYSFMLAPGVGYVMMRNFSARTAEELDTALTELESQGMTKLILDLRGNTGGYLNAAVDVSDMFLAGDKRIVYTKGRIAGSSEEYFTTGRGARRDLPLIVLIDAGSASASEIVSGAIQDWDRGIVAGRTSFGKGLVQRQYRLRNDGALLLTVARYYTPSGRLIQRPYSPGDRAGYYEHAGDELNPEADSARVAAAPVDTVGRPIYHTLLQGRPVYGGGGIAPDVRIDAYYRTSRLNQQLTYNRKYFDYAEQLMAQKPISWNGTFEEFLAQFSLSDEVLADFQKALQADSFAFAPDSFAAHTDEIRRGLSAEVARYLWGEEERYRVLVKADPALQRALELVPAAETMLAEAQRLAGTPPTGEERLPSDQSVPQNPPSQGTVPR